MLKLVSTHLSRFTFWKRNLEFVSAYIFIPFFFVYIFHFLLICFESKMEFHGALFHTIAFFRTSPTQIKSLVNVKHAIQVFYEKETQETHGHPHSYANCVMPYSIWMPIESETCASTLAYDRLSVNGIRRCVRKAFKDKCLPHRWIQV